MIGAVRRERSTLVSFGDQVFQIDIPYDGQVWPPGRDRRRLTRPPGEHQPTGSSHGTNEIAPTFGTTGGVCYVAALMTVGAGDDASEPTRVQHAVHRS
jgi:hypothetical protein